jgi:hypothetical protein
VQTALSIAPNIVTAAAGKWLLNASEKEVLFLQFSDTMYTALIAVLGLNHQLASKKRKEKVKKRKSWE